jgi:hypothetical protein
MPSSYSHELLYCIAKGGYDIEIKTAPEAVLEAKE